jgi:hypothetical protein
VTCHIRGLTGCRWLGRVRCCETACHGRCAWLRLSEGIVGTRQWRSCNARRSPESVPVRAQ